jgi:hypothetical protein
MMEVLVHDIMRYEALSEQSDLFAIASALAGNAPNDQSGAGSLQCKFMQGIFPV